MLLRSLRCVLVLLGCRFSLRRHAFVFHLSSGGSFVREGGLAALARLLCFPVALHLHGSDFADFSAWAPRLIHGVLLLGDRIYVLTEETRAIAETIVGRAAARRVVKIVNGVAVPERLGAKESLVLFAGEAGPRKGIDVLLDAWSAIRAKHPGWHLVIAGPTRDWEPPPVALGSSVTLLGPVTHAEVLRWQARAAVAVLPSRQEALPMFLLEAMARGCAVVATPVGQVAELVESVGILVPAGDPDALADGLHRLLGDPAMVAELADAGRARVLERYSAQRVARQVEREWRLLLDVTDGRTAALRGGRRPAP